MDGIINILYHCNDKKRCQEFINGDLDLIEFEQDVYWLGKGMYFWDNKGNAKYWLREKNRKNKSKDINFVIIQAKVNLDTVLDLTDEEVVKKVLFLWEIFSKGYHIKLEEYEGKLGLILDLMFNNIDIMNQYKSIKVFGLYKNDYNFFFPKQLGQVPAASNLGKLIYLIKDKSIILEKKICEYGEVNQNE